MSDRAGSGRSRFQFCVLLRATDKGMTQLKPRPITLSIVFAMLVFVMMLFLTVTLLFAQTVPKPLYAVAQTDNRTTQLITPASTSTSTSTPTLTLTPIDTPTPTETPTAQRRFAITVRASVPSTQVLESTIFRLATDIEIDSEGCGGGVMDLTLQSPGDRFVPISATRVSPSNGTFFLQAQTPGTTALCVTALGEYSCGDGAWHWRSATGCTPPITVLTTTFTNIYMPLVAK